MNDTTPTPVMLSPLLGDNLPHAADRVWCQGVLIVAYNPRRIDRETALYLAEYFAGGPVVELEPDPADLDESAVGTAPPETAGSA